MGLLLCVRKQSHFLPYGVFVSMKIEDDLPKLEVINRAARWRLTARYHGITMLQTILRSIVPKRQLKRGIPVRRAT